MYKIKCVNCGQEWIGDKSIIHDCVAPFKSQIKSVRDLWALISEANTLHRASINIGVADAVNLVRKIEKSNEDLVSEIKEALEKFID